MRHGAHDDVPVRAVAQAKELFSAVKAGDLTTVTRIINAGFNVNTRSVSDGGATALFLAVRSSHLAIVRFLLSGSNRFDASYLFLLQCFCARSRSIWILNIIS